MRLIVMLATAGLVLATIFALLARFWWAFDLFSHFRLQYAVLALVFLLPALLVRSYPTAAILAVIALVHGWALKELWLGGPSEPAPGGTPLRIASANVLAANPTPQKVLGFVRASDAQIVVLVDARGRRWHDVLRAIGAIYPHRAPQGWQDGAPVILFSRFPIVSDSVIEPPAGQRPYLAADLALGDGRRVTVVGVHPTSPSPRNATETHLRNLQLDYLAEIVEGAEGPIVLAGDFNTTPFSPHFQDLLAKAGLRNAGLGQGYIATWPRGFWPVQIPIDHILVKGPIAVDAMQRGSAIGSDHYPILGDLRLMGK